MNSNISFTVMPDSKGIRLTVDLGKDKKRAEAHTKNYNSHTSRLTRLAYELLEVIIFVTIFVASLYILVPFNLGMWPSVITAGIAGTILSYRLSYPKNVQEASWMIAGLKAIQAMIDGNLTEDGVKNASIFNLVEGNNCLLGGPMNMIAARFAESWSGTSDDLMPTKTQIKQALMVVRNLSSKLPDPNPFSFLS